MSKSTKLGYISKVFDRGYGFIRDGAGNSYFFHCKDTSPDLGEFNARLVDMQVAFDLVPDPKGERAVNVRPVTKPAAAPEPTPSGNDYGRTFARRG